MLHVKNRAHEARDDTLVHVAPEDSLKNLSILYDLPWLLGEAIPAPSQRGFLRATLYGARGTYTGFFSSVRALFKYAEETVTTAFYRSDSTAYLEGNMTERWGLERFIEIDKKLYKSTHSSLILGVRRVHLAEVQTSKFARGLNDQTTVSATSIEATLLPFRLHEIQPEYSLANRQDLERPCEVLFEIDQSALIDVPPHYMREQGAARANDPLGGHIMSVVSNPTLSGDRLSGPHPLYFPSESAISEHVRALFDALLVSGVRLNAERVNYES